MTENTMTENTIVITGASDGIGAAAARELSRLGNTIIVVGRSPEKTAQLAESIGADYFTADFASFAEVRALADKLLERCPRIDVLANNAGGLMGKREVTTDGHEKTMQVNHYSPFLLTSLLLPRLIESKARVINTASVANRFGKIDFDNLELESGYSPERAYGHSKLANILFTRELHVRYAEAGIVTAAFHPGVVASNFAADSSSWLSLAYGRFAKRFLLTSEQGADTLVWLATARPDVDFAPAETYEKRGLLKINPQAFDLDVAAKLWDVSEAFTSQP
jgi:NAD(P)-dependent dehydrogenase (short-subunit alcohol dehydrogenase family)